MKRTGLICLFAFEIALIIALNLVALGSPENSMGNTTISGYRKPSILEHGPPSKTGGDFDEYANGVWIKSHPVPADKSQYEEIEIIDDRIYDRVKKIVESAANNTSAPEGSLEQKISKF